jgi:hypothetical protein
MIYPKQRGYIDSAAYTTPASTVCNHEEPGPCGGIAQEVPKVSFVPGEQTLVSFQKNYDHYYPDYPGYFEISFVNDEYPTGTSLARIRDSPLIKTLDVLNVNVTLPRVSSSDSTAILQLVYRTNNPNAPPVFYQCADIRLIIEK